ncbi:ArnT family glycosyltransferase [Sphingomonas desiccabilis]|uniref:ArnT family glycosyltransferase n=1 Tax=Sphingomonas desiccabilis TaxID=429134 RepID=UPI0013EC31AE|nr:glycosyltransferase family 39 protein [Sphingomonas desiccabilis]MBB3912471.1 4-amino-4-deoxy-L-arabinose transferase-like glycosyltransferase [Sphingomonas desiccabilis]
MTTTQTDSPQPNQYRLPPLVLAWGPVLLLWTLLLLLNPVGYIGGGSDDGRYLEAAQCVVDHAGWCVPETHWAARWPVVLPLAGAIALLGETRLAVGLASAPWAIAAILLLTTLVYRWKGRLAALLAGGVLVLTPVFTLRSLSPSADLPELTFLLGGWLAAQQRRPLLSGLLFGLAIATRETAAVALVTLPMAWLLWRPRPARLPVGMVGLALPLLVEGLVHAATAGDALLRVRLALGHTGIPSSELATGVDHRVPLFNMELVRHWRPATDIHVHWLLDPLLNLLASPLCGIVLVAALGLVTIRGRESYALVKLLALGSAAIALLLIFVLAIDPKPRMFLVVIAAAAAIVGIDCAERLCAHQRLLPMVLLVLIAVKGVAVVADQPNILMAEQVAARWITTSRPALTTDANTKSHFALVPEARVLAVGDGVPRMVLEVGACNAAAGESRDVRAPDRAWVAGICKTGFFLTRRERLSLCLYR